MSVLVPLRSVIRRRQERGTFWIAVKVCGSSPNSSYVNILHQSGNLPSKRMANWLRILAQLAIGIDHFF